MDLQKRLKRQLDTLNGHIKTWDDVTGSDETLTDKGREEISSAVGMTRVLINGRLKNFGQMLSAYRKKNGEKKILKQDLEGLWDLITFQVEDIDGRFSKLKSLQSNQWREEKTRSPLVNVTNKPTQTVNVAKRPVNVAKRPVNVAKRPVNVAKRPVNATTVKPLNVKADSAKPSAAGSSNLRAHIEKMRQLKAQKDKHVADGGNNSETDNLITSDSDKSGRQSPLIQIKVSQIARSSLTSSPVTHKTEEKTTVSGRKRKSGEEVVGEEDVKKNVKPSGRGAKKGKNDGGFRK